ncbi:MAG: PAS domain-containing protein, partial [Elusimicrobiota bacterium]
SIPSSVIMVNKDGVITTWNKKAAEMLNLKNEAGKKIWELALMKRERLKEGLQQCKKQKKPVTVKSISLKNQKGDRFLTHISHIPLMDNKGEFQGMAMVMDDATGMVGMEAELKRKQEEIEDLNNRFKETCTKLKLANMEKNRAVTDRKELDNDVKGEIDLQKIEKEPTDAPVNALKPNHVTIKLGEEESALGKLIAEVERKVEKPDIGEEGEVSWKEKLKICDQIDKNIDIMEEKLQTKKLKDEEPE